jgi:hypothetical protein
MVWDINKDYGYAVLMKDMENLTPEAKYVLIRILFIFGSSQVTNAVKSLEKEIGVSDAVLKKARDLLIEQKYLIRMPVTLQSESTSKRGRPREGFQVSATLISELNDFIRERRAKDRVLVAYPNRLDRFLFWKAGQNKLMFSPRTNNQDNSPKRNVSGSLSPASRVVVAVLYAISNANGVVRETGLTIIRKKSCMTLDRLESQIQILKDQGFILFRISGLTGGKLFGRSAGAFFLNVFDSLIVGNSESSVIVMHKTDKFNHYNDGVWAWRVFGKNGIIPSAVEWDSNKSNGLNIIKLAEESLARIRTKLEESVPLKDYLYKNQDIFDMFKLSISREAFGWPWDFKYLGLHEIFRREGQYRETQFLQYKIEQYASELLCANWDAIGVYPLIISEYFLAKIINEIYPVNLRGNKYESKLLGLMAEGAGLFIYQISLHVALYAKGLVMAAFKSVPNQMFLNEATYSIFPVANNKVWANRFSVAVNFGGLSVNTHHISVTFSKDIVNINKNLSPDELDELMVKFGYK